MGSRIEVILDKKIHIWSNCASELGYKHARLSTSIQSLPWRITCHTWTSPLITRLCFCEMFTRNVAAFLITNSGSVLITWTTCWAATWPFIPCWQNWNNRSFQREWAFCKSITANCKLWPTDYCPWSGYNGQDNFGLFIYLVASKYTSLISAVRCES